MGYVYKITNTTNQKHYIGISIYEPETGRIRDHLSGNGNRILAKAIKKYGRDAFTYEILEEGVFPELLSSLEIAYIKGFNTVNPHGYNLTTGGEFGIPCEETRRKISEKQIGREVSKETRQKKSKSMKGKNVHPLYEQVHQFFLSLPATMTLNQKRKVLRNEFPSVSNEAICNWVRKWKIETLHAEEPQTAAYKLYVTLPTSLNTKQKREVIYKEFSHIERSIIQHWIRKWIGHKDGRSAEYHQVHKLFLSLPQEMSVVEKRQYLYENVKNVLRTTINVWVKQWTNSTGRQPRHPQYKKVYDCFLSLPTEMSRTEKNNVLRDKFSEVNEHTIRRWTRKWQPEPDKEGIPWNKGKPSPMKGVARSAETCKKIRLKAIGRKHTKETCEKMSLSHRGKPRPWRHHPERCEVQNVFDSLSLEMPLSEKRRFLYNNFPSIDKSTICRWIRQWQSELENNNSGDSLND